VLAAADPLSARVFRRIGTLPAQTADAAMVATILGAPRPDVADALERLVDARLVESLEPQRYQVTTLTRLYAAELAASCCTPVSKQNAGPSDRQSA